MILKKGDPFIKRLYFGCGLVYFIVVDPITRIVLKHT